MKKFWEYLIECQKQRTLRKALENRVRAMEYCCGHLPKSEYFAGIAQGVTTDLQTIKELQEQALLNTEE